MPHLIKTTYSGPTDTRGARINVSSEKHRMRVPYDYASKDVHRDAGVKLARKLGWAETLEYSGDHIRGNYYITRDA